MPTFRASSAKIEDSEARVGNLEFAGRNPLSTPHYVAISSRGNVPHITPDLMTTETRIQGLYAGLEDYVEQLPRTPPACQIPCEPGQSPLRRFIALKKDALLVLGPRRTPPLPPATGNSVTSLNISTSSGFRQLEINDYIDVSHRLRPDIIIGPSDHELPQSREKAGRRRLEKMGDRTLEWTRGLLGENQKRISDGSTRTQVWAPILPIEPQLQAEYLEYLEQDGAKALSGLALYDIDSIASIPPSLTSLPRMTFTDPRTPQAVLHAIDRGVDLMTLPFIGKLTDSGVAFTFTFPANPENTTKKPLGLDVWSKDLATSLSPLSPGCNCYACRSHHRAYLRHLLDAKEMLAWTLLQIHNHHQMDAFFAAIRRSISDGTFADDTKAFARAYEDEFPAGSGEGPRLRGYQIRITTAGPPKANLPARRKLEKADLEAIEVAKAAKARERMVDDDAQRLAEAADSKAFAADFELDAGGLEQHGLGEQQ